MLSPAARRKGLVFCVMPFQSERGALSENMKMKHCAFAPIVMVLIVSCVPTPTATPLTIHTTAVATPTLTTTLEPTATVSVTTTPTVTARPTSTPTATPETLDVKSGVWASTGGYHDAVKAYEHVGSFNDEHKHMLDLLVGTLRVGVMVDDNLIGIPLTRERKGDQISIAQNPRRLQEIKATVTDAVRNNNRMMDNVWTVRSQLMEIFPQESDYRNFVVIVDSSGEIQQVIYEKNEQVMRRYKAGQDGSLIEWQNFKSYNAAPLEAKGGKFYQGGKEINLRGAVANHFFYDVTDNRQTNVSRDIDFLKRMGANYVEFFLNASLFDDARYLDRLVDAIKETKNKGLIVKVSLHSRGIDDRREPIAVRFVDNRIISDWEKLLGKQQIKGIIGLIDIVNPLSEPARASDNQPIQWSQAKPVLTDAISRIRNLMGRDVLCFYSGIDWAGNGLPLFDDPIRLSNTAIEIHPYQYNMEGTPHPPPGKPNIDRYVDRVKQSGIPLMVGEMGYKDKPSSIDDQLKMITENGISFAFYAINTNGTDRGYIRNRNGQTVQGDLATYYFNLP
jgi:hypothetical protein